MFTLINFFNTKRTLIKKLLYFQVGWGNNLLTSVNGSCGAGLHPQQLWDWSSAVLVKVQTRDPLNIPDTRLVKPHEIFNPLRFSFCAFAAL